jgi:hypothetical protein
MRANHERDNCRGGKCRPALPKVHTSAVISPRTIFARARVAEFG